MPTPDSNSTEAGARPDAFQPVYLIHDLGLDRCFWAYWPSQEAFQSFHFPQTSATLEDNYLGVRSQLQARYPDAMEINLSKEAARQIYRLIRRAELPEAVRNRIITELAQRRQQQRQLYVAAGFLPHELEDLKALKRSYRRLVRLHHPDQGGDADNFKHLQTLYEQACRRLNAQRRPRV